MTGEDPRGRVAMERLQGQLREQGMPPDKAESISRNAARRHEDGRAQDGHRDGASTWFGDGEKPRS